MTKPKTKLIFSLIVMMFVLLSAVVIVAVAFAAQQQSISTDLTISYLAQDLDGSVSATYQIGETGTPQNLIPTSTNTSNVNGNKLVFNAKDTASAGSLEFPNDIELTSQNSCLILKYTFENTGSKHYIATMSFDSELIFTNMNVEYSIDSGNTYSSNRYGVVVKGTDTDVATTNSYWIKISITEKQKNASFSGKFNWVLKGCDNSETNLSYKSIDLLEFSGSNGSYSASVTSAGGTDGTIVFPSQINGDTVTTIVASSLSDDDKNKIKNVYIPDSVTEIGAKAFTGFKQLKTVTFGQNVTTNAKTQSTSTGLTVLGPSAFSDCVKLSNFQIPNTVTTIGDWCFANNSMLTSLKLPASLTSIGVATFAGCVTLTDLTIEDNDVYACEGNCVVEKATNTLVVAAESVTIPNYVVTISSNSFSYHRHISITIPSSVTTIKHGAFTSTNQLTSVIFENKSGWTIDGENLTSSEIATNLENTETAKTWLNSTYRAKTWTRS